MFAPERNQQILATARTDGRVNVATLARDLEGTPETIRRDLTSLERHGLVRSAHGGAIAALRTVVLADHTKIGRAEFAHVATLSAVDTLITDSDLDEELAAEVEAAGPRVMRA